jgi:hypothetical protein
MTERKSASEGKKIEVMLEVNLEMWLALNIEVGGGGQKPGHLGRLEIKLEAMPEMTGLKA